MKQLTAFVFVMLWAGLLLAGETNTEWVQVVEKAAKFEGQFPARPEVTVLGSAKYQKGTEAQKFMESFKLTD